MIFAVVIEADAVAVQQFSVGFQPFLDGGGAGLVHADVQNHLRHRDQAIRCVFSWIVAAGDAH